MPPNSFFKVKSQKMYYVLNLDCCICKSISDNELNVSYKGDVEFKWFSIFYSLFFRYKLMHFPLVWDTFFSMHSFSLPFNLCYLNHEDKNSKWYQSELISLCFGWILVLFFSIGFLFFFLCFLVILYLSWKHVKIVTQPFIKIHLLLSIYIIMFGAKK